MKPARTILLAVCVLVLASLACNPLGGSSDNATPTFPPTRTPGVANKPVATPVPEEATPAPTPMKATPAPDRSGSGVSLLLTNNAGIAIYFIYISPSDAGEWGEDWLGDQVLEPGMSRVITDIPPGTYDLKAEDGDSETVEIAWEVDLQENVPWTITGLVVLNVINESPDAIADVYVSSVDAADWGDDQLRDVTIEPGDGYTFRDISRGYYDMRATDANGDAIESAYNVPLFGQPDWTVIGRTPLADNAVLRFEDDFSDNHNNWGNVETEQTSYLAPANGAYCMQVKVASNTAWEWYEPFRTDEFIAEVKCYIDGPQDASCGLGFGPDGDNLYWFEISAYDQYYALFLLEDGEWQDQMIEWTKSYYINPNAPNYLSLERVDDVVTVFVNGVLLDSVGSNRFPEGRLGIGGATYDDPGATICLDDLKVWRLE